MAARTFILASGSPARLRLLREAGFDPLPVVSGVPEDDLDLTDPKELTGTLARRKAAAVAGLDSTPSDAVVLGCDSLLSFDGHILGKPATVEQARHWLVAMRGRSGVLCTGHYVLDLATGRTAGGTATTIVHFSMTSDRELDAYLATGEAMNVAGAFTLDGRSAPFIDSISGDPGNVIGLSLPYFRSLLGQLDLTVMDLWKPVP